MLNRRWMGVAAGGAVLLAGAAGTAGQPVSPVYNITIPDCVTGDNAFIGDDGARFYDVDAGCDIYGIDTYERPTVQRYQRTMGRYGSPEYFGYLDLTEVQTGADSRYLYVRIDMFSRDNRTSGGDNIEVGMMERYGFRISTDPDGRYGLMIVSDQPEVKNEPNTVYGPLGVLGYRDTNGDVGGADRDGPTGLTVSKEQNSDEEDGMNGYDAAIIQDGRLDDETPVAWVRLDPNDNTVVELAIDYIAIGYTQQQIASLAYFDVEAIKGGPKDPQNCLWNDKYTGVEAGSPNPGPGDGSEFGTEGLKDIYEADTVRAAVQSLSQMIGCAADFSLDGVVNSADISSFLGSWLASEARADMTGDGVINSADISRFLGMWMGGCL